jgi:hypothetical protein
MRQVLLIIMVIVCFTNTALAERTENDELYGSYSAQVIFALGKANELSHSIQGGETDNPIIKRIPEEMKETITENDYSAPDHIIILTPSQDFNLQDVLKKYSLLESHACTLCFDMFVEVNGFEGTNRLFTEWAERAAIYDAIAIESDFPKVLFVVCTYGKQSPQIVTAMYKLNETTVVTKTSYVYNDKVIDETYAAFPFIALSIWEKLDSLIF